MSDSKERLDLKSPRAIALEIAAAALMAWMLKNMYDRRYDDAEAAEPHGYPMTEYDDKAVTYISTVGSGPLDVETIDEEGYVKVSGRGQINADGQPEIDEATTEADPRRLAILMARIVAIKSTWQEKISQALPDSLQKG